MTESKDPKMIMFHIPEDPKILTAVAKVTLQHSHLDHILRMTIKSLTGVSIRDALDATAYQGSGVLRDRIKKIAKQKLGEGKEFIQLQAILERCKRASQKRNDLVHNIWAQELDGDPKVRSGDHTWKPLPTVEELDGLSVELAELIYELNETRLEGFLAKALKMKSNTSTK